MEQGHAAPKRIRVTKGSCWQCRDRRVKCDTQKPMCGRCAAESIDCDYSKVRLRWGNQMASRGHSVSQSDPTLSLDTQALSRRDAGGPWQVMYFSEEILPRFSLAEKRTEMDLATITQDPALASAVKAVAHTHMLLRTSTNSTESIQENIQARTDAIRACRERVLQSSNQTPAVFHASVLLCILDGMLKPQTNCAATHIHYQGGKAIVQQNNSLDVLAKEKTGLPSLLLTVFSTIDLTHAILSGFSPIFSPDFWRSLTGVEAWWSGLENDNTFLELMALLSQLARHAHATYTTGELPEMKVVLSLQLLMERSKGSEAASGSKDAKLLSDVEHQAFCAAYRSVAGIFMYRVLCGLDVVDDLVQQCVHEGLNAMCETSFTRKYPHCLLFPILIIGSHCLETEGRNAIIRLIQPSLSYLGFGSVGELENFLTSVWKEQSGSSNWWSQFESIASKAFIF